jgi:hypothetical protein
MTEPSGRRTPDRTPRRPPPRRSQGRTSPATAGMLLVATIVTLGGAGLGLGALVGLPLPFALAGVFAGLAVGFALVYSRFKDI